MSRPVVWFIAGVMATILVISGVAIGVTHFGANAEAQGTWQVKLLEESTVNAGYEAADPDKYVDDWVATIPISCDIVSTTAKNFFLYRCP